MRHILIVDDDNINCVMARHALSDNYKVSVVNSGKEALDFLEGETVDLILMDIEMPQMSGKEVASKIKENDKWCNIPIIFLTADSDPKTEAECLSWGADDFITKPFVPLVMNTRVSRILEVYELRKDLENKLENRTKQYEKATQRSLTDALTGLHNRDYLKKKLAAFLEDGGTGTLFMIDLDDFKQMNDTYGHIVGDKTLQNFAEVLNSYAREGDIVCRLAGDEFVTFYPGLTDEGVAAKKAEGIIKSFAEKMGELGYGGVVSVSIGIMVTHGGEDIQSIYNKADKSLYFVKNNGKNAYHFYGDSNDTIESINTEVDLEYVSHMMKQGLGEQRGIMRLAYDEFKNIYDFVSRYVSRNRHKVQVVLFTMNAVDKRSEIVMEDVMQLWEEAVSESLRAVDTGTRYSNSQYMVILMDAGIENGKDVAERVIEKFFYNNKAFRSKIKISYDIRSIQP